MGKAMIALGIGFSSRATSADIIAAIDAAISSHSMRRGDIGVLATAHFKQGAQCLADVASILGIDIRFPDEEALALTGDRLITRSSASRKRTGSDCLCEAAALAVLDGQATLVVPRQVIGPVTCAMASGELL